MKNSKKFALTAVLLSLLVGCSTAPTDDTTVIEDTTVQTVQTVQADTTIEDAAAAAGSVFYFDFDKAVLKVESRAALLAHSSALMASPRSVRLEGHADERGTREYNMALGERRANAVKEFMVLQGVSSGLIEVISYGEERAASYGSNDSAWEMNRRVELK
ncbi:MAG: OmpA family protein [Pseudomonadales bacterium]|jgi:peptidoglycan-associated lipoprotein|tara:strand:- start:2310 stop:2789 length:480 start_codon:yes stop_codon:yes gene_type:complete